MGSHLGLVGLILPLGSRLVPKSGVFWCLPREPPWCAPLGCKIWLDITFSGISSFILGIGAPCNLTSWARKVLIGYQNQVPRSVSW